MLKIMWKRGEIAPEEQFLLLSTIFCYLMSNFYVQGSDFFFEITEVEITEVEITRVDCIKFSSTHKIRYTTISIVIILLTK